MSNWCIGGGSRVEICMRKVWPSDLSLEFMDIYVIKSLEIEWDHQATMCGRRNGSRKLLENLLESSKVCLGYSKA